MCNKRSQEDWGGERSIPSQYGPVVRSGVHHVKARLPRGRGSRVGVTSEGTETRAEVMLRIWCAVMLRCPQRDEMYW